MIEWLDEFTAAFAGGGVAATLLTLAHLLWWDSRPNLPLVARYTIGVACLNTGLIVTGAILADLRLVVLPWIIAGIGGAVVAVLHLWRHQQSAYRTINLVRRAIGRQGAGDGAWEAKQPNDRSD